MTWLWKSGANPRLRLFRDAAFETREYGFDKVKSDFIAMGAGVRDMMEAQGLTIVAAQAGLNSLPGVRLVTWTTVLAVIIGVLTAK
jgi:hypothetical protein